MSWYHMSVKREPELGDASKDGAFLMWKISQSRSTNMIPNFYEEYKIQTWWLHSSFTKHKRTKEKHFKQYIVHNHTSRHFWYIVRSDFTSFGNKY